MNAIEINYDGLSFWVSVAALSLTLLNWIFDLWKRRTKVSIEIKKEDIYGCAARVTMWGHSLYGEEYAYSVIMPILFTNCSEGDIAITRIELYSEDGKKYVVSHRQSTESFTLDFKAKSYTTPLPITLLGMESKFAALHTYISIDAKLISATVFTNKRTIKAPSLALFANDLIDKQRDVQNDGDNCDDY